MIRVGLGLALLLAAVVPAKAGALVVCRPAPAIAASTPNEPAPPAALCPEGRVPQPIGRIAPKGMPQIREPGVPGVQSAPETELYYFYAATFREAPTSKAEGKFTQAQPYLAPGDYHSLAELAAESADASNIIEVGWTVDPVVNNGDLGPHLFVFHWVNGSPTCYNGCGWVQVSATLYPGMPVAVSATPQKYAVRFDGTNWWVGYQEEWIGYFPGSLWVGQFTQFEITQWFGEVSASSAAPCTQMGDGVLGTGAGAAQMAAERIADPGSPQPGEVTDPDYYALGAITGAANRFGGPGAC